MIARRFPIFKCEEAATAMEAALKRAGYHGQRVILRTTKDLDGTRPAFIVCNTYNNGKDTITKTGYHWAIRLGDKIYDNLHPDGMEINQWLKQFEAFTPLEFIIERSF